ncbi:MAG: hypothetical protein ACE5IO_03910 [Thermoplasmata archaeon]
MPTDDMLESEKRVLYGLVKYPNATDRELGSHLSMKTSTVTAVRRKLYEQDYCVERCVPFLQGLNCEMLMVSYIGLNSTPSIGERLEKSTKFFEREEIVYGVSEPRQELLFQMSQNYTDAKKNIEDLERLYRESGYLEKEMTSIAIPFGLSEIPRYFDYAPLLHGTFWPEEEYEKEDMAYFATIGQTRLRQKEKKIFRGMCDFPMLNDVQLSEELGVSRMTVGRARKRFFGTGFITRKIIPNLEKLGFELLAFTHGRFNPSLTEGLKHYVPRLSETIGPNIFLASTRDELIALSAFRNFTEYRKSMNGFAEVYKEKELFSSPPERLLFSTKEMKTVKNHEYGPFVGKALGLL